MFLGMERALLRSKTDPYSGNEVDAADDEALAVCLQTSNPHQLNSILST